MLEFHSSDDSLMEVDGILNSEIADGTSTDQSGQTHLSSHVLSDSTDNLLTVDPITDDIIAADRANEGSADDVAADDTTADSDAVVGDKIMPNAGGNDIAVYDAPVPSLTRNTEDVRSVLALDVSISCEITSLQADTQDDVITDGETSDQSEDSDQETMENRAHQLCSRPVVRLANILEPEFVQELLAEDSLNESVDCEEMSNDVAVKLEPSIGLRDDCGSLKSQVTGQTTNDIDETLQIISETAETIPTANETAETLPRTNETAETLPRTNETAETLPTTNETAETLQTANGTDETLQTANGTDETLQTANGTDEIPQTSNETSEKHPDKSPAAKLKTTLDYKIAFPCYICAERFFSVKIVQAHGREQHGLELSEEMIMELVKGCSRCGIKFRYGGSIRRHREECKRGKSRRKSRSKSCTAKRKHFETRKLHVKSLKVVKMEMKEPSLNGAKNEKTSPESICFPCLNCPRVFYTLAGLSKHTTGTHKIMVTDDLIIPKLLSEVEIVSPTCSVCDMKFTQWSKLYKHMRRAHAVDQSHKYTTKFNDPTKSNKPTKAGVNTQLELHHQQNDASLNRTATRTPTCGECKRSFCSKGNLKRHIQRSHSKELACTFTKLEAQTNKAHDQNVASLYSCSICSKRFRWRHAVFRHLRYTHQTAETNIRSMILTVSSKNNKKAIPHCSACNITFLNWPKLYLHLKHYCKINTNKLVKKLQCARCKITFETMKDHQMHMLTCESDGKTAAGSKMVKSSIKQEKRIKKEHTKIPDSNELVFPCHLCGQILTKRACHVHLINIHSRYQPVSGITIRPQPDTPQLHIQPQCAYCGAPFEFYPQLYKHWKMCELAKSFKSKKKAKISCLLCLLLFQNEKQLDHHHKYIHDPHNSQSIDNMQPLTSSKLGDNIPQEDLVYPCEICGRVMLSFVGLHRHMKSIHKQSEQIATVGTPKSEAEFTVPRCECCQRVFCSWKGLYSHQRKRHLSAKQTPSISDYSCHICGLSFRNNDRLQLHKYYCQKKVSSKVPQGSVKKPVLTKSLAPKRPPAAKPCHVVQTRSQNPIICDFCEKEFVDEIVWFQHLSTIHRMTSAKCEALRNAIQVTRFESLTNLSPPSLTKQVDIKSEHITASAKKFSGSNIQLRCSQCNFSTRYAQNLSRHCTTLHGIPRAESESQVKQLKTALLDNSLLKGPSTTVVETNTPIQQSIIKPNAKPCSDTSSEDQASEDQAWPNLSTDIESSSSDSSDSDDEEIYMSETWKKTKRNYPSSSSSSSSDGDVIDEDIFPFADSPFHEDTRTTKVCNGIEKHLLTSDDILHLDENIFVKGEPSSKAMVPKRPSIVSNGVIKSAVLPASTSADFFI